MHIYWKATDFHPAAEQSTRLKDDLRTKIGTSRRLKRGPVAALVPTSCLPEPAASPVDTR